MATRSTAEEIRARKIQAMGQVLGEVQFLLWQDLAWLHIKWSEYHDLYGAGPEVLATLNGTAPTFFRRLQKTLWEDILLHLCRLTDRASTGTKGNLTVQRLPLLIEDEGLRAEVQELAEAASSHAGFARDWRNRYIAHNDLERALNPGLHPLKEASVQLVNGTLDAVSETLNRVDVHFHEGATSFRYATSTTGAKRLLYYLDKAL